MSHIGRLVAFVMALVLSLVTVASAGEVGAPGKVFVGVNDELLSFPDADAEMVDGKSYVPLRYFAGAIGAELTWEPRENVVSVVKGKRNISLEINQARNLYLKNNRTMVPFRYIGEHFGYDVSFMTEGPVARAKDAGAQLTDEQFVQKYHDQLAPPKPEPEKPSKVAYLTFDDGPNEYTGAILDLLKEHGMKATFFVLSGQMERHPDLVKRIYEEGHAIGLHGVTHDHRKIYQSPQTVVQEMEACNAVLTNITGYRTSILRVPYGSKPYMTQPYRDAVVNAGYRMWDWNVDSTDSSSIYVTADTIVAEVTRQTAGHEMPVILMHDRKATLQALPQVLAMLKEQGYAAQGIVSDIKPLNFWEDQR